MFTKEEEKKIQDLENATIISYFLAVNFARSLQSEIGHVFLKQLKDSIYNEEFKEKTTAKQFAQSKKRLKTINQSFANFKANATDILKIASLNPQFMKIFEDNSNELYSKLEQQFKSTTLEIVNKIGEETYKQEVTDKK